MFVGYLIVELNRNCVFHHSGNCRSSRKCYVLVFYFPEKLKLDRDFSKYNYLSLDSATVNGLDDAANFRTVRVSYSVIYFHKFTNNILGKNISHHFIISHCPCLSCSVLVMIIRCLHPAELF